MDNEQKLFDTLKKTSATTFDKDTLAIHYGDGVWINKQKMLEDLEELKEKILTYHDLHVINLLIEKLNNL